ncbi:MAG: sigma-70 family RNA polymerase sigma factor [Minisyncoccia bacterium]
MDASDEELIAEYLAGREESFAVLVQRHVKGVYSFIARSVGEEADDIVQETFFRAWKNLKSYDSAEAKFKTWLMRIARNATIDYLRKKKPALFSAFENDEGESFLLDTPDTEPLPDELVARANDAREVQTVLEGLSPAYREVLLLRYMNQLTFEEISAVLGMPANTVRSRHHRGLAQLRKRLQETHQKRK